MFINILILQQNKRQLNSLSLVIIILFSEFPQLLKLSLFLTLTFSPDLAVYLDKKENRVVRRLLCCGSPNWARTSDIMINSHALYRLSYGGIYSKTPLWVYALCWHLPIFPGRHQPSIFGTTELNLCVRYGNRWTLSVINTNYSFVFKSLSAFLPFGDSCGNRTRVAGVRGRSLNRLTNEPCLSSQRLMVFALISPCNFSWCTIRGSNPGHPD